MQYARNITQLHLGSRGKILKEVWTCNHASENNHKVRNKNLPIKGFERITNFEDKLGWELKNMHRD
jgi:hypothetical protein